MGPLCFFVLGCVKPFFFQFIVLFALFLFSQPVRPELEGLGQVLVDIMQLCWVHEPEARPAFLEIEQRFSSMS